jgi:hypothetical protein
MPMRPIPPDNDSDLDIRANPSAAPLAGGATTTASRFGGVSFEARLLKLVARFGRHLTGFAYRRLASLELRRETDGTDTDRRVGPAGAPKRTAGAKPPQRRRKH